METKDNQIIKASEICQRAKDTWQFKDAEYQRSEEFQDLVASCQSEINKAADQGLMEITFEMSVGYRCGLTIQPIDLLDKLLTSRGYTVHQIDGYDSDSDEPLLKISWAE